MSESSVGPNIVLVGGSVTLDSGVTLDSRQRLEGDHWDFTLRSTIGDSEAYWTRAKELSDRILAEGPPTGWALAWVNKTVKRPMADGTVKRVRSVSFLDHAADLTARHHFQGSSAIKVDALSERYRIMPYMLRFGDIKAEVPPSVILGAFHTTYPDGTDIIGLRPLDEILTRWPEAVIVLPHTPLVESKVRSVIEWASDAADRPARDPYDSIGLAEITHPRESRDFVRAFAGSEEIRAAEPHVIDHELRVTFWVDQGLVRDPADLEAALAFMRSRYDLKFGLWDLARDRILRTTLLKPEVYAGPSAEPAPVPTELKASGKANLDERLAAKSAEREARRRVHQAVWPSLEHRGWEIPKHRRDGEEYHLPVGPRLPSPFADSGLPAVFFALVVHKKQAVLNLFGIPRIETVGGLIAENAGAISSVAGSDPEPEKSVILRLPGRGWDGDLRNWDSDADIVEKCVQVLIPHMGRLIDEVVEYRRSQAEVMSEQTREVETPFGTVRISFKLE